MGLVSAGKALADVGLSELKSDSSMTVTLTFKRFLSEAFDEALGHNVDTFDTSLSITAVKTTYTESSVKSAGSSEIQVGDIAYLFKSTDLSDPSISQKDEWYEGTQKLQVITWKRVWDFMLLSCAGDVDD